MKPTFKLETLTQRHCNAVNFYSRLLNNGNELINSTITICSKDFLSIRDIKVAKYSVVQNCCLSNYFLSCLESLN